MAEDRERFDALLERFPSSGPPVEGVLGMDEALNTAHELGYPVLLRPSYVIGGQNMVIAHNERKSAATWRSSSPARSKTRCWWTST